MERGFIYDDVFCEDLGIIMIDKEGDSMPSFSNKLKKSNNFDGAKDGGVSYDERIITIECFIIFDTVEELNEGIERVASFFNPRKGLRKLTFTEKPNRYFMARLFSPIRVEELQSNGRLTLELFCPDSYYFGETIKIPLKNNKEIKVGGAYETKPVIEITLDRATSNIKITNITTAQYVSINHNFNIGDKLVIDFNSKKKVKKNGIIIDENVTIPSDFFYLYPGEVTLRLEPTGMEGQLHYIERWL